MSPLAITIALAVLWLIGMLVLRLSYRRGGSSWSDYARSKLDAEQGGAFARLSGFSTEAAVLTIGIASLAAHVWMTRTLGPQSLPPLPVVLAALAFAVLAPLGYCRWAQGRMPEGLAASDSDRKDYARGYSYYWIYGAVLLVAAGIEGMIVAAEWQKAAAGAARTAEETRGLLAFAGADAGSAAVRAKVELAMAGFERSSRALIDLIGAPLLPLIAVLVVLYLFMGGSGFHASFAGGGAALVYALACVLVLASAAALFTGLTAYTALAAELQSKLQPLVDAGRALPSPEAVRRYLEIGSRLEGAQGLSGFAGALADERGFYYGLFIAVQAVVTQLVIVMSKRLGAG